MKTKIVSTLILTVALSYSTISNASKSEWQIYRLLKPTFQELQSEVAFGTITEYKDIQDKTIEKALNRHFERIEYMSFTQTSEENK